VSGSLYVCVFVLHSKYCVVPPLLVLVIAGVIA
jgi:hypothetical protein